MNERPPTIYIVDDDEWILWLYQRLLWDVRAVFKVFRSAREFLDTYVPGFQECLICDLQMPELGGLDLQRELIATQARLPIIFVSAYSRVPSVVEAIKGGALDFLEKPVDGAHLQEKVRKALGQSRQLHFEHEQRTARQARLALLTQKERLIAEQVVAGHSSRQISDVLGISVRTVENHRARILQKLGVNSSVELVHLLYERH
ncbi:two-component system response regulator (plasmid) [Burkholderia sp. MSMB0856]|uniref:response regulator transcription factor n=1 Tax=Burkholderia sp. MSMB0856 TaxID=1637869 RepID=UPI0008559E08|nr:response regulator [Burkholderia sp. MSMB0856]AOJ85291.1 two-component system response regulator [Burkholderia sp. MSMB0856]